MKPLLLTLLLSLSLAGFGQDTLKYQSAGTWATLGSDATLSSLYVGTGGHVSDPVYDTVAVWLEYADTTKPISYNMTVKGYEVREITGYYWTSDEYSLMAIQEPRYKHVCYLNYYKQPITFLVWETKERREK